MRFSYEKDEGEVSEVAQAVKSLREVYEVIALTSQQKNVKEIGCLSSVRKVS